MFVTVFDITRSGFKDWTFPAFGLVFVVIGTVIAFGPQVLTRVGIPYLDPKKSRWRTFTRFFFLGFAVLWTVGTFFATYSTYARHLGLAESAGCQIVEGPVENFKPMPESGHAMERFSVSGVPFSYSDYVVNGAFNNTSSHGGPIRADSYVRVCYDPTDHAILKLEIKNFRGVANSPSAMDRFLSIPSGRETRPVPHPKRIPLYTQLLGQSFTILLILDAVGILSLYRPYLMTFWRLGSKPVEGTGIPDWLPSDRKVKLRNGLAYWDQQRNTIWLRPRGLNYFRSPSLVARFTTDDSGRKIMAREIRLSSGLPVVFVLFFATAYLTFSATMPKNAGLSPAMFVGITFVFFVVVMAVQRGRVISQLEQIADDALSEFRDRNRSGPA